MFLNLHLLRAVAALSVVYYHTTSEAGLNLPPAVGSHAVDLFFVVSGFMIARTALDSPQQFLLRRIIRIVPLYWTATLMVFSLALFTPHILHSTRPDYRQLLCSLLFIPYEMPQAGTLPTLILGWTLNYEMYFYVVFAIALAVEPRRASLLCSAVIIIVAAAITLTGTTRPVPLFYARPLVLEFVYGICAYHLIAASTCHDCRFAWYRTLRGALWILAVASACAIGFEEAHNGFGVPRFIAAGVPAFVLVVSLAQLERVYGACSRSPTLLIVGDSSYALYLVHPYIVYGLLRAMWLERAPLTWPASTAVVVALMAGATVTAVTIHLFIEKPVTGRLREWLLYRMEGSAPTEAREWFRVSYRPSRVTNALRRDLSHGRG
jgi:peptidoglycan/LPS O-acetylase OafA/YrhL